VPQTDYQPDQLTAGSYLTDPAHYDAAHADVVSDLPFWRRMADAAGQDARILELACGTGRVALHLAKAGFEVCGIDLSPAFIEAARRKAAAQGLDARFAVGDMRDATLVDQLLAGQRFERVFIAFNSLGLMLSVADLTAAVAAAAACLAPGGELIIDTYPPDMVRDAPMAVAHPAIFPTGKPGVVWRWAYPHPETGLPVAVDHRHRFDAGTQLLRHAFIIHHGPPAAPIPAHLTVRLHSDAEMQAAFAAAGLQVSERLGDHRGGPWRPGARHNIWVGRARHSSAH
jgi:SAM-dependent methyltransferase